MYEGVSCLSRHSVFTPKMFQNQFIKYVVNVYHLILNLTDIDRWSAHQEISRQIEIYNIFICTYVYHGEHENSLDNIAHKRNITYILAYKAVISNLTLCAYPQISRYVRTPKSHIMCVPPNLTLYAYPQIIVWL